MKPEQRFGKLTSVRRVSVDAHKNQLWLFRCDCGSECTKRANDVSSGKTRSCGCYRESVSRENATKHGHSAIDPSHKRLYWVWVSMRQRCSNPSHKQYKHYGGRGIFVCEEWRDFQVFLTWASANGYIEGLAIDRIDNDGPYSPTNCHFITAGENNRNRRNSRFLSASGIRMTQSEWEFALGLRKGAIADWKHRHGERYAEQRLMTAINARV